MAGGRARRRQDGASGYKDGMAGRCAAHKFEKIKINKNKNAQ